MKENNFIKNLMEQITNEFERLEDKDRLDLLVNLEKFAKEITEGSCFYMAKRHLEKKRKLEDTAKVVLKENKIDDYERIAHDIMCMVFQHKGFK